jgi:hypothetical protein
VRHVGNDAKLKATSDHRLAEIGKTAESIVRSTDTGLSAPKQGQIFDTASVQLVEPLKPSAENSGILNGKKSRAFALIPRGDHLLKASHERDFVGAFFNFREKIVADIDKILTAKSKELNCKSYQLEFISECDSCPAK